MNFAKRSLEITPLRPTMLGRAAFIPRKMAAWPSVFPSDFFADRKTRYTAKIHTNSN